MSWASLAAEEELRWPGPDVLSLDEQGRTIDRQGAAAAAALSSTARPASSLPSGTPAPSLGPSLLPLSLPHTQATFGRRPASPSSVEKLASLLRSVSFLAGRPRAAGSPQAEAERREAFDALAVNLRSELRSEPLQRFEEAAPALVGALRGSLLSAAALLLGAEGTPRAFEWARDGIEELRPLLPAAEPLLPGAYYREILEADMAQLSAAVATAGRELERRRAISSDVLAVISRPAAGAAELAGVGRVAAEAGLHAEAAAAAQAAEVSRGLTAARAAAESAEDTARAAKRDAADSKAALKRERRDADDAKKTLAAVEDERNGLRVKLTQEVEARRRVEAASVKTLEQLKLGEEARWAAERTLQVRGHLCVTHALLRTCAHICPPRRQRRLRTTPPRNAP
eukprot:scaffold93305_cov26-Tisochrysis_lutea.AAC.3